MAAAGNADRCPECGQEVEHDAQERVRVCIGCGFVVEESALRAEPEFVELQERNTVVVQRSVEAGRFKRAGTLVHANDVGGGLRNRFHVPDGLSEGERQAIRAHSGSKRVTMLAAQLHIPKKIHDEANEHMRRILASPWSRRRVVSYLAAACVYISVRQNALPVSCMDVSAAASVPIFSLFRISGAVQREFGVSFRTQEPSLYVERACADLGLVLGRRSRVLQQAVRILDLAKDEWLNHGRKPQLVCGAAITLALENNPRAAARVLGSPEEGQEAGEEVWEASEGAAASAAGAHGRPHQSTAASVRHRVGLIKRVCAALGGVSERMVSDRYLELREAAARVGREGLPWSGAIKAENVLLHLDAVLDFAELRRMARAREEQERAAGAAGPPEPLELEEGEEAGGEAAPAGAPAAAKPLRGRRGAADRASRYGGPPAYQRRCAERERWRRQVAAAQRRLAGAAEEAPDAEGAEVERLLAAGVDPALLAGIGPAQAALAFAGAGPGPGPGGGEGPGEEEEEELGEGDLAEEELAGYLRSDAEVAALSSLAAAAEAEAPAAPPKRRAAGPKEKRPWPPAKRRKRAGGGEEAPPPAPEAAAEEENLYAGPLEEGFL